ncbi:hypothetical protein [Pseudomonas mandelii]|uniref:hypothetical protein n=1 Tax=Pseudomonas mandelii TaxID=75612 RepID=UPI003D0362E7
MSDKFEDFVRQLNESAGVGDGGIDLVAEKEMWFKKADEFYSLVRDSLDEYTSTGMASLDFVNISLSEELLGTYSMKEARISLGRQIVKLTPVGTFLVGARGRIDMKGPKGLARFVVVPPGTREPRIRVSFGEKPTPSEPVAPPETWIWKIATPPPRITYIDVTKESFREALMGVVNG